MSAVATLPNFFLVGAPKAATTSLYHYLDQHPQIYMSPIKEPCHFSDEIRPANFDEALQPRVREGIEKVERFLAGPMTAKRSGGPVIEWEGYLRLFERAGSALAVGEASVCYLWSESAARNIQARIPDAKILMVLRDPADRAWSQYRDMLASGVTASSFRDLLCANLLNPTRKFGPTYPLLEFGLYGEQAPRYLDLFPRDAVRIYLYDELREAPEATMSSILEFLGVDPRLMPDMSRRHRDVETDGVPRTLSRKDREYLVEYYAADIARLESLLARDLSAWRSV